MGGVPITLDFFRQQARWTKQLLLAAGHWMLYDLWPIKSIQTCVGPGSICGWSLKMIGQKLRPVSCNTQTNRQTVKRTYLQISAKFFKILQKLIKRVQNSPIPLIRGRRLRIWSQIKATSNSLASPPKCAIPRATLWAVDGRCSSKTDRVMAICLSWGHLNMNIEDNVQSLTVTS